MDPGLWWVTTCLCNFRSTCSIWYSCYLKCTELQATQLLFRWWKEAIIPRKEMDVNDNYPKTQSFKDYRASVQCTNSMLHWYTFSHIPILNVNFQRSSLLQMSRLFKLNATSKKLYLPFQLYDSVPMIRNLSLPFTKAFKNIEVSIFTRPGELLIFLLFKALLMSYSVFLFHLESPKSENFQMQNIEL